MRNAKRASIVPGELNRSWNAQKAIARKWKLRLSVLLAEKVSTKIIPDSPFASHAKKEPTLFPQNRSLAKTALADTLAKKTINALSLVLKKLPTRELKESALLALVVRLQNASTALLKEIPLLVITLARFSLKSS